MASEPTYNLVVVQLSSGGSVTYSSQARFNAAVVAGGEFTLNGSASSFSGTAFGGNFSFNVPANGSLTAYALVPTTVTSLSGTWSVNEQRALATNMQIDLGTDGMATIATIPANSNAAVTISWTATSVQARGFTRSEALAYIRGRS
jgi:hypothetical protein